MTFNSVGTNVNAAPTPEAQLERLVLAHMLWEDQFYVSGKSSASILATAIKQANPEFVAALALVARSTYNLRHVPLYLMVGLARLGKLKAADLTAVIQRADEMGEFLALYWKDKKVPLANQVKKGLADAIKKFKPWQLSKWDKGSAAISVRDVMFLTHPKPDTPEQSVLFKKIADNDLPAADTWETELSAGGNKAAVFERLMSQRKLGALAFIRNLRNMLNSGIAMQDLEAYAETMNTERVLPFRYISALRQVPQARKLLNKLMLRTLDGMQKLSGRTVLVVDVSGSMVHATVSEKSDLTRLDAAIALTILAKELCEDVVIYITAGSDHSRTHATRKLDVSGIRGLDMMELLNQQNTGPMVGGGGIFLVQCMEYIAYTERLNKVDRVIVFTDEQDCGGRGYNPDAAPKLAPQGKNYILNVGSYEHGINPGGWLTITGFSENSLRFIQAIESDLAITKTVAK